MKLGYARVSTKDQTTEQQEHALRKAGCERLYIETASGAKADRPKLAEMLHNAREGDTIVIWKLDRLARSTAHLIRISEELKARGIELQSLTDQIDTNTASGKLTFGMLAVIAQFERDIIQERIMSGLERAKKAGKVGGRPRVSQDKIDIALAKVERGETITEAAKSVGISRATLYRARSVSKAKNGKTFETSGFETGFETKQASEEASRALH